MGVSELLDAGFEVNSATEAMPPRDSVHDFIERATRLGESSLRIRDESEPRRPLHGPCQGIHHGQRAKGVPMRFLLLRP